MYKNRSAERKFNRMQGYNYSQVGEYFVTICVKGDCNIFGEVLGSKMKLNKYEEIAQRCWQNISIHFLGVTLDAFVIMPDHVHGIIIINPVGYNDHCTLQRKTPRNMELLPKIISQYKSSVTREIRKAYNDYTFTWQKSFYDRIIETEKELNNIRHYIYFNPVNWEETKRD